MIPMIVGEGHCAEARQPAYGRVRGLSEKARINEKRSSFVVENQRRVGKEFGPFARRARRTFRIFQQTKAIREIQKPLEERLASSQFLSDIGETMVAVEVENN